MKKSKLIVMTFILFICFLPKQAYAQKNSDTQSNQTIQIILDDKIIEYNEDYGYPFINDDNRTLVPFRKTLEFFGAEVQWNDKTKTAYAIKDNIMITVPIGEKYIYKNEKKVENDTYAVVVNQRTYLPIRIVMESFGCQVEWDAQKKAVIINTRISSLIKQLPEKYDLRTELRVTSVKDQMDRGTCWAFASIGAFESTLMPDEVYDFSEDNLSLLHGYNLGPDEGGDFNFALSYFARWSGPVLEKEDVYDGVAVEELQSPKHLQEALMIPSKDYNAIKKTVIQYGGVQTSLYLDSLHQIEHNKYYNHNTYAYYYSGFQPVNHDVVIVGWDDTYPKENFVHEPPEDGAFICKNSYGTKYGEMGYIYVSYHDTYVGDYNIVYSKIEDKGKYDKIYQTDWLGVIGRIGYKDNKAYFSNVYETSDIEELLKAVSFYTTDENSHYEVFVVEDFDTIEDFDKKVSLTSGELRYKGYYTIDLEEPIPLKANSKFAVVVKIITPNSEYPVAAEFAREEEWLGDVVIDDGEGYISSDGSHWQRTEEELKSNICLKAFTTVSDTKNQSDEQQLTEMEQTQAEEDSTDTKEN